MAEPNYEALFRNLPGSYLVFEPSLRIVAASNAYLKATSSDRAEVVGRFLFDVYPREGHYPSADAVRETRASIGRVLQSRTADEMPVQRHEIPRAQSEGGGFELRYWSPSNTPVLDPDGSIACIIHRIEDVTELVLLKERNLVQDTSTREPGIGAAPTEAALPHEVMSRFFDKASDELRTPLTLILGPLERLLDGPGLDSTTRKALSGVQRSARALQRHIGELLGIVNPHAGEVAAQNARTDPDSRSAEAQPGELPAQALPIPADVEAPHVLIIQNHPDLSAFLAEALGRRFWISRACDGHEGIQKALMPDRPDLIIADVAMPDMGGQAMVDELRRQSTLEDVPIVMLTTREHDALCLQLLRQGIQDYLLKPFSVDELLARVQSLLARWKRTGQRLRQSEERYRTLFNSVDQGFCIVEMIFDDSDKAIDYLFIETNPSFEKQSGLVDVQGKRMRELSPAHEEHWFEIYGRVAMTGEPVRFERYAEQLGRWFDAYAFRYGDRENRQVAVLFDDITDRKQAEAAMQEADRRKDQFLALLAHELRNPLAPIRNAVQILRMAPAADAPTTQLLPMMERQLAHMARLLDDLLDVSRIANGMIELRRERTDVVQAVQTAVEANRPLIDSKGQQLTLSLPADAVMLDADPVRLAQIVSNLLNNAAHYSRPGGSIHLSIEPAGSEVRLSVKDSGIGIHPDDLENVFGLFVQLGEPFTRRQGGLGIGLSLVRTLVHMHGGAVHARSAGPGHGSEFIVTLPVAAEPVQSQPRSRAHARSNS